jgi:hypothetical protein
MTLVASPYFEGDKRIGIAEGEYGDGSPCFEVVYLWADTESYRDAISTLTPRRHFGSFAEAKQWIDSEQWRAVESVEAVER